MVECSKFKDSNVFKDLKLRRDGAKGKGISKGATETTNASIRHAMLHVTSAASRHSKY
jgi:hypothetical protein